MTQDITVLQLPKFKAEATKLNRGRWCRDGRRIFDRPPRGRRLYTGRWYVVVAARVYLLRCNSKNVMTDLSGDEKKELRRLAAALKGAQ